MRKITDVAKFKRKDLATLERRPWDERKEYKSLLLVPTGRKQDSGWHLIAVVGIKDDCNAEIAAYCDDINYIVPMASKQLGDSKYLIPLFRTDMTYPSGICHIWGNNCSFIVGRSLSSTDVTIKRNK